jgi:protein TonB
MRCLTLLFSLCLHGTIAGFLFLFSADQQTETERVYHVALAEFVQPGIVQEAPAPEASEPVVEATPPPPPPPPAPDPEPEVIPLPPDTTPEPPKEPEPKVVSTIKPTPSVQARPATKPSPPVTQPSSQPSGEPSSPIQVASGPRPRQFGGLSAYDQDHVDQRPSISRRVEPEYPSRARRMNIVGTAMVELVVDTAGLPKACAIRSAEPSGYFEEAALNAAQKMRFIPGKINGAPVNTLVLLPFVFRLR